MSEKIKHNDSSRNRPQETSKEEITRLRAEALRIEFKMSETLKGLGKKGVYGLSDEEKHDIPKMSDEDIEAGIAWVTSKGVRIDPANDEVT